MSTSTSTLDEYDTAIAKLGFTELPKLKKFAIDYAACALWTEEDELDPEGEHGFTVYELPMVTVERIVTDCGSFMRKAGTLLDERDPGQGGHDFWLTRNHHGAGFWEKQDWPENGDALTDLAHKFPEASMYLGDDGKVYFD